MTKTKACPKCRLTVHVVHKDHFMQEQNHAVLHHGGHMLHGAVHGSPVGLGIVAGSWVISKIVNMVSKPWRCNSCGHDFA